jgi:hypothetical protein
MRQLQAGKDRAVGIHYIVDQGNVDEVVMARRHSKRDVQDLLLDYMKAQDMSIADIDMADRLGRRAHLRPFEPSRWPTLDPLAVDEREETLPRETSPMPGAVQYLADLATGKLTVGIGDVTSSAKGSGARYNNGKPDLSLIPLRMLASALSDPGNPRAEVGAL